MKKITDHFHARVEKDCEEKAERYFSLENFLKVKINFHSRDATGFSGTVDGRANAAARYTWILKLWS